MAVEDTLIVSVGASIARLVLRQWLRDAGPGTESLLDTLKAKTNDVLAQQRARRQFEAMGEQLALNLLSIFEREGACLDIRARELIAEVLAETLECALSTPPFTPLRSSSPTAFAEAILAARPGTSQQFTEQETALYGRLVGEISQYVVDIGAELPQVNDRNLPEILKQENFSGVVQHYLDEVARVRQVSEQANPQEKAQRYEESYRRALIRTLDRLELFGADLSEASKRHRLSVAYITLNVQEDPDGATCAADEASAADSTPEEADHVGWQTMPVDRMLGTRRLLLIRGLAGSGKTTLLQWIAVRSAAQDFQENLRDWNGRIPFFIRLRQFSHGPLPELEMFPGLVADALDAEMPAGWVTDQLKAGRAVVLIDGMDEIPEQRRTDVRGWIDDLTLRFPNCHFIVTARPYAIKEGWIQQGQFANAELQPMTLSDVGVFIDHWHQAVAEALPDPVEKQQLAQQAEQLKSQLKQNTALRDLTTNPLLCALLCALNRDRHGKIPSDRTALYQACCEMLMYRRDEERGVDMTGYPNLSYRQKRRVLEDLAYWMIRNGYSQVPMAEARDHLDPLVGRLRGLEPQAGSEGVLRLLVERTGIVREPVKEQLDFTHRTFEEFLAAQAALDAGDIEALLNNANDDQWREVVLLAIGLASGGVAERIITGLLERGDAQPQLRHTLHLLAVAGLESAVEVSVQIREQVKQRLAALVPPQNLTEASALASAGELALPYLRQRTGANGNVVARCVRTLALIGGSQALDIIAGYAHDKRQAVRQELYRAWDRFDRAEYAQRIMKYQYANTETLSLDNLPSLEGFECFPHVKTLTIEAFSKVSDLRPLSGLTSLQSLDLGITQVSDLNPLAGLTNLQSLNLNGTQVSDLNPLAGLTNLQSLSLRGTQVSDLNPLAGLINLQSLNLERTQVSDLNPLAGLTRLQSLDLRETQVSDLIPLTGLTNLQSLSLRETQASDLAPLADLTGLQGLLDLDKTKVSDLTPLAGLTNLQSLSLRETQVSDLTPLAGLTSLQSLDVWNTQVSDVTALTDLTSLQSLYLWNTQVSDVAPLAGLTKLQILSLWNTQVSDVAPLAGLNGLLVLLDLGNTRVSDVTVLAGLNSLKRLSLRETQVSDLTPLANLTCLEDLYLEKTSVSDLTPLSGLTGLRTLGLIGTKVSNITPLSGLTNLQVLDLTGTSVSDLTPLSGLTNLTITGP